MGSSFGAQVALARGYLVPRKAFCAAFLSSSPTDNHECGTVVPSDRKMKLEVVAERSFVPPSAHSRGTAGVDQGQG